MKLTFVAMTLGLFLVLTTGFGATTGSSSDSASDSSSDSSCDETTVDEIECEVRVADRAAAQLEKDWAFLSKLAHARNPESIRSFNVGQVAFQNFVLKNCESESHDVLGGSLQDVIEQECRRETLLARQRLFQNIGTANKLGRSAERTQGRPICETYLSESKPLDVAAVAKIQDTEDLRKYLDRIGRRAARSGLYTAEIRTLPRLTHIEAERFREIDALYTCQGIAQAFCPNLEGRLETWLSRCQTDIRSAFYKKASVRLRALKAEQ